MPTLEICVDSLESAINAEGGGANRIELCSSLCLGGLTPTIGLLKMVKNHVRVPVFCMLRPRHDNFVYTSSDIDVVTGDLQALMAVGADGFVFGALTEKGEVDEEKCKVIMRMAAPLPVTFHRAFDCSPADKWKENLNKIISLGFTRLLTSGLAPTAIEGMDMIQYVIKEADGRIIVMIGSGVDERNLFDLIKATGGDKVEYHGSASAPLSDSSTGHAVFDSPYPLKVTISEKVRKMRAILDK